MLDCTPKIRLNWRWWRLTFWEGCKQKKEAQ